MHTAGYLRYLSKTMHQYIALAAQSSFCIVRHLSSSVLICSQPTVLI